jgi:hypothetical protein
MNVIPNWIYMFANPMMYIVSHWYDTIFKYTSLENRCTVTSLATQNYKLASCIFGYIKEIKWNPDPYICIDQRMGVLKIIEQWHLKFLLYYPLFQFSLLI